MRASDSNVYQSAVPLRLGNSLCFIPEELVSRDAASATNVALKSKSLGD
jgi:hypothetical protein